MLRQGHEILSIEYQSWLHDEYESIHVYIVSGPDNSFIPSLNGSDHY